MAPFSCFVDIQEQINPGYAEMCMSLVNLNPIATASHLPANLPHFMLVVAMLKNLAWSVLIRSVKETPIVCMFLIECEEMEP